MLSLSVAERSEGKWEPGTVETGLNGSSSLMPDVIARGTFRYRNPVPFSRVILPHLCPVARSVHQNRAIQGSLLFPPPLPPNAMVLLHTCRCRQGHLFSLQRSHRPPDAIRRTICRNFFRLLCPVPDDETVIVHGNGDASMQGTCHCMPCVAARVGVYAMTARILVFRFCHIAVQLFFKKSAHIHYMHRYIG